MLLTQDTTIFLTQDMNFLQKSYGEYSKVEKPVLVTMSYEGLDDEEELETVPIVSKNNNNNYPRPLSILKRLELEASYSNYANKTVRQAMEEKMPLKI